MNELIDKYRKLFERNGCEFHYVKTWHGFSNCYQHHFLTRNDRIIPPYNICRQFIISDKEQDIKNTLDRILFDTARDDKNFKFTFKEDVVLKILAKIDE